MSILPNFKPTWFPTHVFISHSRPTHRSSAVRLRQSCRLLNRAPCFSRESLSRTADRRRDYQRCIRASESDGQMRSSSRSVNMILSIQSCQLSFQANTWHAVCSTVVMSCPRMSTLPLPPSRPNVQFNSSIGALLDSKSVSTINHLPSYLVVIWLKCNVPCACYRTRPPLLVGLPPSQPVES